MRILVTSMVDLRKAAHNRIHQFVKHLSPNHEITVLSINDWWKAGQTDVKLYTKDLEKILQKAEIRYFTGRETSPIFQELFSFMNIERLLKEIDYRQFDIHLNCGTLVSGYMVARKMKSIGVETIYDIADNNPEMIRNSPQIPSPLRPAGGLFGSMMLRRNIRIARRIIYVTTAIKESCHIPEHKSDCVPNGVDTSLFRNHSSEQLRDELGLAGKFVIGYVGVLREWVKLEPIFAVVRQLEESHPEIRVLIVGQEGRFQENKDLAKAYGIADKVIFTGTVPYAQVPSYISCMDVCTVPFEINRVTNDPCPLKLFEYMACERPVISALEITAAGNNILHAFSTEEYRHRILELHGDQTLRRRLGSEGRRFVEQNYDWAKISSNLEKILIDVAS